MQEFLRSVAGCKCISDLEMLPNYSKNILYFLQLHLKVSVSPIRMSAF